MLIGVKELHSQYKIDHTVFKPMITILYEFYNYLQPLLNRDI